MYRFIGRCAMHSRNLMVPKISLRSLTKFGETLTAVEKQKSLQLFTDNIMGTSMVQTRTATATATAAVRSAESMPLLEPRSPRVPREIFEVPKAENVPKVAVEKRPLAFEEVPGPAILKLWEKYWKYVPVLGTQLFSSLLINSLTQGRLTWNRNITPLKYLFNEYGPIVRINGPMMNDVVMIHRPEHIAEVLKQEGEAPVRSGIDVLEHYRQHYRKNRLPGPFSVQGSEWLETKSSLEKPLAQQLFRYSSKLETICDEFSQRVRRIRNRQDEVPGHFDKELSRWGMESFSILMFNKRLGFLDPNGLNSSSEPARIIEALMSALVYLSKCENGFQFWRFFETPFSRRLFEACDVIDGFTSKYVRQAQSNLSKKSSTSYDSLDDNSEEGSPILEKLLMTRKMQPDDISALLMDMIVLGVQATVNSQAFLLYFLAKNPRIQRKIHEEINLTLPSSGASFTTESLGQLRYLKACLRESLRLRPAFPYISRLLPETITLHGYTIPKGTYLIMASQISSQREENFEDPEKFRPERWLTEDLDENSSLKFSCLPFGHGVRSCLGKNIAETEIMLLTAKLLRKFRIEYDYADIESRYLMVNVPNRPLRFRFVDRD